MPASKTALITGATDGVGRVVARRLAKDGWRVLVHGRSAERGQSLVQGDREARAARPRSSRPTSPRSPRCARSPTR